jgi:hypothetical protein
MHLLPTALNRWMLAGMRACEVDATGSELCRLARFGNHFNAVIKSLSATLPAEIFYLGF